MSDIEKLEAVPFPMVHLVGKVVDLGNANTTGEGKGVRNISVEIESKGKPVRVRAACFGKFAGAAGKLKKGDEIKISGMGKYHDWEVDGLDKPNSTIEVSLDDENEEHLLEAAAENDEPMALLQSVLYVTHAFDLEEVGKDKKTKKRDLSVCMVLPKTKDDGTPLKTPSFKLTILGKDARDSYERGECLMVSAAVNNQFWEPRDSKENCYRAEALIGAAGHEIKKVALPEPAEA